MPDKRHEKADAFTRRMNKVLDHIDAHLAGDLRLEQLAALAAFSPFHFHRVFRAWTGETLQDFVRRRRLEAAGGQLRFNPDETVTEVAHACGFASGESLARAFHQHFGMTPTAWRQGGHRDWEAQQRPGYERPETPYPGDILVRAVPELQVVYLRHRGEYRKTVPGAWDAYESWAAGIGLDGADKLGMGIDDPTIVPASRCRYDTCAIPPEGWTPPGRISSKRVAGGAYACLHYRGRRAGMSIAWRTLLVDWLPASGYALAETPFVEAYAGATNAGNTEDIEVELRMPLAG